MNSPWASQLEFEENSYDSFASRLQNSRGQVADALRYLVEDPALRDSLQAGAFMGWCKQDIVLIAPRLKTEIGLPVRLGEKVLWRFNLASMRILPSSQRGVLSIEDALALLAWLRSSRPEFVIAFTDLMTDTPLFDAVRGASAVGYRIANLQPAAHLFHEFRESYEKFFFEKPSKYKNQLRRREKLFRERFGSSALLKEYRLPHEVLEFLRAADSINKKTYQYKLFGERVDCTPEYIQEHEKLASSGRFRSFVLWYEKIPLCFVLGFQGENGVFEHRMTGFDPEWRAYSPGIYCNVAMLQRLYEADRPTLLDFGSGDADYKRLFANVTRESCNPYLMPSTGRLLPAYFIFTASNFVNDACVAMLERAGIKDRLKRLFRHQA